MIPSSISVIDLDNALINSMSTNLFTSTIQTAVPKTPVSRAATRVLPHNEKRVRAARLFVISPRSGLARTQGAVAGICFLGCYIVQPLKFHRYSTDCPSSGAISLASTSAITHFDTYPSYAACQFRRVRY